MASPQNGQPYITLDRGIHIIQSLRFTSGVTPADLLAASMATELISFPYLQVCIGGAWDWEKLHHIRMLYRLSYAGFVLAMGHYLFHTFSLTFV